MNIELGFGNGIQMLEVPDANVSEILVPNEIDFSLSAEEAVRRALENPIGSPRLRDIVKPGEKIAIVTSDITRPMPTYAVMPFLFTEFEAAGVSDKDITLVFALGSHRKHTDEEKIKLAGEETFKRIACIDGDVKDCVHLGTTVRGTPVDIVRTVAEADKRICLGNIEYHYFAGYSGGAKAIMPGVSTRDAIQSNHRMMIEKDACAGNLDTNPLRQDIEEAARICGVDFILNVVLDEHKKIIYAVAGNLLKAHREGCRFLETLYGKRIKQKADIVVVSQGGAPKDLNLYQTQKALDNAKHAVKDGGIIILVGSCKEGLGEKVFEEWMTSAEKPQDLVLRIKQEFKLGGHKAAAIALVLEYADIYLVSDMEDDFVKKLFFTPFKTVQAAFDAAFEKKGTDASVLVMPYGGSTLPKL
ncbi:MAG: nickel-dependent lactate racemase [Treponema sp.]|uniref:nickel-dependent lactate racemase n=1 Tax=Treponema sp. TaxID=166 RepID=UPI003FA2CCF9